MRLLVSIVMLSAEIASADVGYTLLWWADGLRGVSESGRRLLHVQTSEYGAGFDVEHATLTRLGRIRKPLPYAEAVAQPNTVINRLPEAELRISVVRDGRAYACVRAARQVQDHIHYPVRQIDGGRFLQRFDILGLEFEDEAGGRLDAEGRLEVAAWPDRMHLTLSLTSRHDAETFQCVMELCAEKSPRLRAESTRSVRSGEPLALHLVWPEQQTQDEANGIEVAPDKNPASPLPVSFDAVLGGYLVNLPEERWEMSANLDRLDRFRVRLVNDSETTTSYPLVFAFDQPFQGITGLCPMLRDATGQPTGIPVQISKNWHRRADQPLLYEGPWFHGVTRITVPPRETWSGEFAIAYARWGGVPAASHAQLCLIGWGGNQLWDQAAIGSFGESICYDPEVGLNRSMIDDVRPLMVTGMNGGKWEWTHNVGGGDFLVYFNASAEKQFLTRMKTAYLSQGPNLTQVVYAGVSADQKIAARIEVQSPRGDDLNRAYHRIRYEVREDTDFSRLSFYQLGADHYNDHQFATIARGTAEGLLEAWETERGGSRYLRNAMPCTGDAPWFALLGGVRSPQFEKGAWADRAIVIRTWKARLGGMEQPTAHFAVYGTENGVPSANIELVPPLALSRLRKGDYVEADIELLVLPQRAEDYYGPNAAFRAALAEHAGSWRLPWLLACANDLDVAVQYGTLKRRLPVEIQVDRQQRGACTVRGGMGHVPITFTGLKSPTGHRLEVNGAALDQSVHGNDFWQTTWDDATRTYAVTWNIDLGGAPDAAAATATIAIR